MSRLPGVLFLVVLGLTTDAADFKAPQVFPLADIKPGMTGVTHTVLQGTEVVPIHTEIFGVLPNAIGPGHDLIIGRLNDEKTRLTFAVHGMSGSPLYIDGKIAGALSRRVVQFEKDAFCGFTPIQDMLDADKPAPPPAIAARASSPLQFLGPQAWFRPIAARDGMVFQPFLTPLVLSGVPPRAMPLWTKHFGELNFLPVLGGGSHDDAPPKVESPFVPGAPMAAVLARGAFTIGGTGTMTFRNGAKVYGFGHPMLWLGSTKLPMARAEIIATVPSYLYPYKISRIAQTIGTITQDRLTAIAGEVGPEPRLVPMKVEITPFGAKSKTYEMELVDDPQLTPRIVGAVFGTLSLLSLEYTREFSMDMDAEIALEGLPSVTFRDFYSGDDGARFATLLDLPDRVHQLYNNPFAEAKIKGITLRAALREERRQFLLEEVWTNRDTVKPGDEVVVRCVLRAWQGDRHVETFTFTVPEEAKSGEIKLLVGDADVMRLAELGMVAGSMRTDSEWSSVILSYASREKPNSLTQLVEILNRQRPHNCLYYRLSRTAPGQLVHSKRLTGLPPSALAVRESRKWTDDASKLTDAELFERRLPVEGVLEGKAELKWKLE